MRKTLALTTTLIIALSMTACGNTSTSQPASSSKASTAPTSSVAEKKDDYVYIGGKTPYEVLTDTEEANIKKAEEEARLQAEAKAKAQAEAKAKADAEAKKQVEQQQQAQAEQQPAEQPQQMAKAEPAQQAEASSGDYRLHTYPDGTTVRIYNNAYLAHKAGYEYAKSIGDELGMRQAQAMMEQDLASGVDPNSVIGPRY